MHTRDEYIAAMVKVGRAADSAAVCYDAIERLIRDDIEEQTSLGYKLGHAVGRRDACEEVGRAAHI